MTNINLTSSLIWGGKSLIFGDFKFLLCAFFPMERVLFFVLDQLIITKYERGKI